MRTLLTNLFRLAGMQIVLALTGIVRNKVLALRLGPDGLGEFQQIFMLVTTVGTLVAFGLGTSLNRNVAAAKTLEAKQKMLANSNFMVWGLSFLAYIVLGVILWQDRSALLAQVGITTNVTALFTLILLVLFIPLNTMQQNQIAFLTGTLDIKSLTEGRILAVIIGTVLSIPLVWFLGLPGAALQFIFLGLVLLFVLGQKLRQLGFHPFQVQADKPTATTLAAIGIASLLSGFSNNLSILAVRTGLIKQFGAEQNGYYQAAFALSLQVKTIVLSSVGSYALASISQQTDRESINKTTDLLLKVVLPIALLAMGLLGIVSLPALVILYSPAFLASATFMPALLTADFLETSVWILGSPVLALGKTFLWLILNLVRYAAALGATFALFPMVGPQAVVWGSLIAVSLRLLLNAYVYLRVFKLTIAARHLPELLGGPAFIFAITLLGTHGKAYWQAYPAAVLLWSGYLAFKFYMNRDTVKEQAHKLKYRLGMAKADSK